MEDMTAMQHTFLFHCLKQKSPDSIVGAPVVFVPGSMSPDLQRTQK